MGGCGYLCFSFEDFTDFYEDTRWVYPRRGWNGSTDFLEFDVAGYELVIFLVADEAVLSFCPAPPFLGV